MSTPIFKLSNHQKDDAHLDELSALRELYDLKKFNYVDVFSEESVLKIIHKWSLFLELSGLEDQTYDCDANDLPLKQKE